jgi:hypothetical protein
MGDLEATERRAFVRTRPSTTDALVGDCGAVGVGDPDL